MIRLKPRLRRRTGFRLAAAAAILFATGCATTERTDTPTKPGAPPPAFSVLETLPPSGVVRSADLYPSEPGSRSFAILDDTDRATGDRLVLTTRDSTSRGADFQVDIGSELTLYLRHGDDAVLEPAVRDHGQGALTRFDPPLVVAYAELHPGERREHETAMRVLDAKNPRRQRESGRATHTAEYIDDQRISCALGTFVAQRVEVTFTADLRLARAYREETIWIVPEVGVIARDDRETLTILGLPAHDTRRRIVLTGD